MRHDCGEKRGGRYFVKSSTPLRIPRGVRCTVGRTESVIRRRCERNNRSHVAARGLHVRNLSTLSRLYLDYISTLSRRKAERRSLLTYFTTYRSTLPRRKAEREVGGSYSMAINSYFGSLTGRSAQKVATPQTRAQKRSSSPACMYSTYVPATSASATAERLHLC